MSSLRPLTSLPTHEVSNQAPPLENVNLYTSDTVLRECLNRQGGAWAEEKLTAFGARVGSEEVIAWGFDANRHPPELETFDRFGRRIDEVRYHPSYHKLMDLAISYGVHSVAWTSERGGHVVHAALEYLLGQAEQGVCCPVTMTYAAVPCLRNQPELGRDWEAKVLSTSYDPRVMPAGEKAGLTFGMAMTEKQGGSDVRANTTRARPLGRRGPGEAYELTGHKWFCSAPMSDAFLSLAHADGGLSCFLVPRWLPDGDRNPFFIQRLKDKLGNRANASAEIEYDGTYGVLVGGEGEGVKTIIEMVHHTRLDATMAPASLMRQALSQALHHTGHRCAFGKRLKDQALMRNVLADLALESEAATTLLMHVAGAFDESEERRAFARLAVALSKYWLNKRAPGFVYEALECHGGAGYIEESMLPRLYREAPLNSIWEGAGNVICLDVLRTLERQPQTAELYLDALAPAGGQNRYLDASIEDLKTTLGRGELDQGSARHLTERMALTLQAALLAVHAPNPVSDAFCETRLGRTGGHGYGTLPAGTPEDAIIQRAWPEA